MIEDRLLYKLAKKYAPQSLRNRTRSTVRLALDAFAGLRGLNPKCATPDFLIVGAQKAGTTSLFGWLVESGLVQSPMLKEIGYFDARWHLPIKYRGYFKSRHSDLLVGEATPSYLAFPEVPERVRSTLGPECKIIIVLREPVARAVSHYFHERRLGFEKRDMYEAMVAEQDLIAEAFDTSTSASRRRYILTHNSYVYRSTYSDRLAPWLEQFDRENLMILNSEAMFLNPSEAVASVADFLGADIKNPTSYKPRNRNSYVFEDNRVATFLEERLSDEQKHYKNWDY